jgi:hypothetical protein
MEAQLSAGIVRLKAAALNIPEGDCCGEAVEGALIWLIVAENVPFPCHAERRKSGLKHPYARHGLFAFGM